MRPQDIFKMFTKWRIDHPIIIATLAILLVTSNIQMHAQVTYVLDAKPELSVSGTSTIHDWMMISNTASGMTKVVVENRELKDINSLKVTMPVVSLKSGKGSMDTNAYKALKADRFPEIIFELTEVEKINGKQVKIISSLTISGTARELIFVGTYEIVNNKIQFSGEHAIKFSEFNVNPPTAVFGTIRTGDDLILSFKVIFSNSTTKITKQ